MSPLSSDDWLALMQIARRSISSAVLEGLLPDLSDYPDTLKIHRSAFVTLYLSKKLRGCIGHVEDPGPLAEVVASAAIGAALHDPRFPPMAPAEVASLGIELSVLSPLAPIAPESIVAGRHGLLAVHGRSRGVLLPQVAAERGWSGRRLLEETCEKAGLAPDAWRDPATKIFGFTAETYWESGKESDVAL
jgi:AmmeMemoRadiSam system protein A